MPDSGFEQVLEWICVGQAWVQPHVEVFPVEHERDAFRVDVAEPGVWWQGDDGERRYHFFLEVPQLIQAGKGDGAVGRVDVVALFVAFLACPFMEAAGRYDGALTVKPFLPEWAGAQAARSGVEGAVLWRGAVAGAVWFPFYE